MLWCRHIFMVGSLTLTSLSCNLSFVLLTRCGLIGLWSVPCCLYILYNKHCTDDYFELDCWMSAFFTKNCQQCKKIVCEKKSSYDSIWRERVLWDDSKRFQKACALRYNLSNDGKSLFNVPFDLLKQHHRNLDSPQKTKHHHSALSQKQKTKAGLK